MSSASPGTGFGFIKTSSVSRISSLEVFRPLPSAGPASGSCSISSSWLLPKLGIFRSEIASEYPSMEIFPVDGYEPADRGGLQGPYSARANSAMDLYPSLFHRVFPVLDLPEGRTRSGQSSGSLPGAPAAASASSGSNHPGSFAHIPYFLLFRAVCPLSALLRFSGFFLNFLQYLFRSAPYLVFRSIF